MTTPVYPALLIRDAGAPPGARIGVVFPDLPDCTSQGDDARQAAVMAIEALATHAEAMVADGEDLPEPSAPRRATASLGRARWPRRHEAG